MRVSFPLLCPLNNPCFSILPQSVCIFVRGRETETEFEIRPKDKNCILGMLESYPQSQYGKAEAGEFEVTLVYIVSSKAVVSPYNKERGEDQNFRVRTQSVMQARGPEFGFLTL